MEIDIGEFTPEELLKSPLNAKTFLNLTKTSKLFFFNYFSENFSFQRSNSNFKYFN